MIIVWPFTSSLVLPLLKVLDKDPLSEFFSADFAEVSYSPLAINPS
jgi:hypothetical protein